MKSELGTACGGHPIGSGLVFVSDNLAAFEYTNEYLSISTSELYKKWMDQRKLSPKGTLISFILFYSIATT